MKKYKNGGHGQEPGHPWFRANGLHLAKKTAPKPISLPKTLDGIIRGKTGPMGARWALEHKPPLRSL